MGECNLQSLLFRSQERHTDRTAFARAVSRISYTRIKKEDDTRRQMKSRQKAA
ncbi:hypothetical protein LLG46_14850 [bacterium]|nr:hypothetical protein [bacterium]